MGVEMFCIQLLTLRQEAVEPRAKKKRTKHRVR
jgi:hypothetical protein